MICYRFAAYATPLRTVAAALPARFNSGHENDPTQYLSLHPLGPHAELIRNADLRTPEQIRAVRIRTWALDVPLHDLQEISFDTAGQFGITAEDLVADDHSACRRLAGQLRGELPGLIVPSAALPGTQNVILFGARVAAPYPRVPVTTLDVPASVTAEAGRPLVSLLDIVRFPGDLHPALAAWQDGTTFAFVEPDWSLTRDRAN